MTLIEATISIVIVATMIVMALNTFGSLARSRQLTANRYMASALASQLMSEVLQNFYEDSAQHIFGPEPGEAGATRANFDDVDDYNGWTESPPTMKDGTVIAGLTAWRRKAIVEYIDPDTMVPSPGSDKGVKWISVIVTDPKGVQTSVVALRSKAGTYDIKPVQETTCLGWVGVELQVGKDSGSRIVSGADVLTIVPVEGP